MTDYQDKIARKRSNPSTKYDITGGLETADGSGDLAINTKLTTLRGIVITPILATGTDTVMVQVVDYATPSAVTGRVTGDDGSAEANVPCFWMAWGYID